MEKTVTIEGLPSQEPGQRDNGKTYSIRPMKAYDGQKWVLKAMLALAKVGVEIKEELLQSISFEDLMDPSLSPLIGNLDPDEAMELIDGLLKCVSFLPSVPNAKPVPIPTGDEVYIQEIKTRNRLAREVWEFHRAFF